MIERKMLSLETTALLDKLYNLRGEDSVILVEMEKQKNIAEETKTRTSNEKIELQGKITELETEHADLNSQGDKLADLLSSIDRNEYSTVLDRLEIEFNPVALKEKLDKNLPDTITSVEKDIEEAKTKLATVEEEMSSAETTIQELGIRRDMATDNQKRLNEYFDLALTGSINITRDAITNLLTELSLSDDEAREGAKLLMFPEDALYEYDRRYSKDNEGGKSISEVFAEAKETTVEVEDTHSEETVEEDTNILVEPIDTDNDNFVEVELDDNDAPIEDEEDIIEEPVEEDNTEDVVSFDEAISKELEDEEVTTDDNKDEVINKLNEFGIDYNDINNEDMEKLVANFDEKIVENNIKTIKKQSIDTDMLVDNVSLLYDKELSDKINLLISVGKEALDIYFNSKVLVKYDYKGLYDAIELLKENGLDPKKVPLMAY